MIWAISRVAKGEQSLRWFESTIAHYAAVAELADAQDLKSCGTYTPVPVRFRSAAAVEGKGNHGKIMVSFFCR